MKKTTKTAKKAVAVRKAPAKKTPAKKPLAKKPAENEALSKKELADISASLLEMKIDIAKNVEDKKNLDMTEPDGGDTIDQATQSLDKEILFELSDNERKILRDIEAALRKMEKGTYGVCEHCKNIISKKRIKAMPSARYCMDCQNGSEKSRAE